MLRIASIAKINARTKKIEKRARIKYKQAKKKKKKRSQISNAVWKEIEE